MKQFTLLTLILFLLAACAPVETPATAPGDEPELIQADLPRLAEPDVDQAQLDQLVQANNRFAFELYQAIRQESDDNLIYSPYSISLAFSMVYAGARGQTEAEMAQVLHFLPQAEHHLAFNALDQYLASLAEAENGDEDDEENGRFQLNIANAVWGQVGLPFEEAYLATLAQQYGAGLRASDFVEQPEEARREINDWIAEQTEDRIQDILAPGAIDPMTRLVLANAIYFNAGWRFPFDANATQDGPFTLLDGSQVDVPLMRRGASRLLYSEGPNYQAVVLPYGTQQGVEMLVILPEPGQFEAVEAALDADYLQQVRREARMWEVALTMPRFEFDTDLDLKDLLTGLGMQNPFTEAADFSQIVATEDLYISDALHKGTITVDEEGTEAAAATVIVMEVTAMFESAEMIMDRPFIFAIMDQQKGTILFLGRVVNPA